MRTKIFTLAALILLSSNIYSQNITNTLGSNGSFYVKEGNDTLLTIKEISGYLGLGLNPSHQQDISKNFQWQFKWDNGNIHAKECLRIINKN